MCNFNCDWNNVANGANFISKVCCDLRNSFLMTCSNCDVVICDVTCLADVVS